jgi:type IV secretory pathway protease TraF
MLWFSAALALLALLLMNYVCTIYRVDSGSMRPTIFGGRAQPDGELYDEWTLVRFRRDLKPKRFDLAVVRSLDGSDPMVKRVVGLPDEEVYIVDGDLFIDGRRLPADAPRPGPIPVFDDRYQVTNEYFEYKRATNFEASPWTHEIGSLGLDARDSPVGSQHGLMLYHPDLRDSHLDRQGRRHPGLRQVNDGAIECEFQIREALPGASIRFRLVEEGDSFEVELTRLEYEGQIPKLSLLRILRWNPQTLSRDRDQDRRDVLVEMPVNVPRDRWIKIRFSNVDNHLTVISDELRVKVVTSYETNVPYPGRKPAGDKSIGSRVAFGGERIRMGFRAVRVFRDLFYTSVGTHATGRPIHLGPRSCFVLGDNSAFSTDSRHFGAVDISRLVGEPIAIVWPSPRWIRPVTER